ncbi:hypothetical protein B0T22DRAFT_201340 [Podospora appendiculata]|uniref:Uncharacterized protein n=1 Tax=Podospora appendiculata TaxID=314037 RepID=A0AAE1C9S5_9PEZI|nr:hypothetical protein B0T22DRAFT_201340 [Podospora appendiculata]
MSSHIPILPSQIPFLPRPLSEGGLSPRSSRSPSPARPSSSLGIASSSWRRVSEMSSSTSNDAVASTSNTPAVGTSQGSSSASTSQPELSDQITTLTKADLRSYAGMVLRKFGLPPASESQPTNATTSTTTAREFDISEIMTEGDIYSHKLHYTVVDRQDDARKMNNRTVIMGELNPAANTSKRLTKFWAARDEFDRRQALLDAFKKYAIHAKLYVHQRRKFRDNMFVLCVPDLQAANMLSNVEDENYAAIHALTTEGLTGVNQDEHENRRAWRERMAEKITRESHDWAWEQAWKKINMGRHAEYFRPLRGSWIDASCTDEEIKVNTLNLIVEFAEKKLNWAALPVVVHSQEVEKEEKAFGHPL